MRDNERRDSFEVDDRLTLLIDRNLAWELAMVLSDDQPDNPAVKMLGQHFFNRTKPYYVNGVDGGSKWRRVAVEFGGAGWVKVSERCVAVKV